MNTIMLNGPGPPPVHNINSKCDGVLNSSAQDVAYRQVTVDVITEVEHFGPSPASESQELVKVPLQWSDRNVK